MIHVSSHFDSGNIVVLDAENPWDIRLEIRKDNLSDFYQWFHFRVTGARGRSLTMKIVNAGGAAYPAGWQGYQTVASTDRDFWYRAETSFDGTTLTIEDTPDSDVVHYAYFAPYSMERHADLVAEAAGHPRASLEALTRTLDGQDLDMLTVGEPAEGRRTVWAIARQHPGETMAEWWMEGFLGRLLDADDALAERLLERAVFHVVPNMNPDGSRRGHLRTNAVGANLNREWAEPTPERSPEVLAVRARMEATGVDFCLDVHGDEALPYNFIANTFGIPSLTDLQRDLTNRYKAALRRACPDFQTVHGYGENVPGKANLTMCSNWVAERFGCLAMTLEQPFKDNAERPEPVAGWSPERCRKLGAAHLDGLAEVIDDLR